MALSIVNKVNWTLYATTVCLKLIYIYYRHVTPRNNKFKIHLSKDDLLIFLCYFLIQYNLTDYIWRGIFFWEFRDASLEWTQLLLLLINVFIVFQPPSSPILAYRSCCTSLFFDILFISFRWSVQPSCYLNVYGCCVHVEFCNCSCHN